MDELIDRIPGFLCVDHIAVAVMPGQLDAQVQLYIAMGFTEVHREEVHGTDQVREVMLRVGEGPNMIQLLEPLTPESPVARQIRQNGGRGGLVHVAFRVADIGLAFESLKRSGFNIIDEAPRRGSRGTSVFFVHPKTGDAVSLGYLFEVVQNGT